MDVINKISTGEIVVDKKSSIESKLDLIKDELLAAKDLNLSYPKLNMIVKEQCGIDISTFTLTKYCREKLGFPPRNKRKISKSKTKKESSQKTKRKSPDAAKALSRDDIEFD